MEVKFVHTPYYTVSILKVRGPECHDKVPQPNERAVMISKETNHNMAIEHHPTAYMVWFGLLQACS